MSRKADLNLPKAKSKQYETFKEWYCADEKKIHHPVLLERFLGNKETIKLLKEYNLLYVLKTKAEPKVFKVGKSENGPKRLLDYDIMYGRSIDRDGNTNRGCTGVYLYYLIGTKVKRDNQGHLITPKAVKIKTYESKIITTLTQKYDAIRGTERFKVSELEMLEAVMSITLTHAHRDDLKLLRPTDKIDKILDTKNKFKKIKKGKNGKDLITPKKINMPMMLVQWSRGSNAGNKTWETEEWVRNCNRARKALEKWDAR